MEGQPVPSRRMVAVIDDDPAVRSSLQFSLEIEGYDVSIFESSEQLLHDPEIARFQCFIVDQHLHTLNGLELVKRLRDLSVLNPVILVTSRPNELLRREAVRFGAHIVEKPLLGNVLVDAMDSLLGSRLTGSTSKAVDP